MLKFNFAFAGYESTNGNELLLKYPVIAVVYLNEQIVELRFDSLRQVFWGTNVQPSIYLNIVEQIRDFFYFEFDIRLNGLDMSFMINVSKSKTDDIVLLAQYMNLPTGGKAQLEVGNNQKYEIPFLGELKSLLTDYRLDLEKVPDVHKCLQQLIYECEEMAEYPWIEVQWDHEIKTRRIRVKFIFSYMQKDYGLVQHYYNQVLIGEERMRYVAKYIARHKDGNTRPVTDF